jgi:cation diffusion facilitator CzcD-associated flavoprotein CzcO/acetyl esterase/lipase
MSRYVPRPAAKLLTRALQRSTQRSWIPLSFQRAWIEAAARITRVPPGITIAEGRLGGVPCERVSPDGADEGRAVLYLHGGAYVLGSPRTHRALAAQIAKAARVPVHVLDYRLAPEHTHPAALEDALAAYRDLLAAGIPPGSIAIGGDSAGAGLAIAVATRLRDAGERLPAGLVLLNGWFDLTCSGRSMSFNARRDAGLARPWTVAGGELYRGDADPATPELSPVHADLTGLPPTYVQVGTDDILLSDSDQLVERARAAGVEVSYRRFEGMWHDFQAAAGLLREADDAVADVGRALTDTFAGRPLAERGRTPSILIVGAGFGGIGMGMTLKRAGIESFTILEKGEGVGGVWRDNTYPGATCDVPSHLYSFSFEPNPDWSARYSPQPEILGYLERCVARYGLESHLRLGTEVASARSDEGAGRWRVQTTSGEELEADVLVSACGQLSRPAIPAIEGLERFRGPLFHSARWDHQVELTGKRVAVIGTGASTIQIVPGIAERVAHLDVYQRSAPYVIPKMDRPYAPWERRLFRRVPLMRRLQRFRYWLIYELVIAAFNRFKPLGQIGVRMFERQLSDQVDDPELRRALTPDHVLGCKRILISDEYLATLGRPNVELVTQGVSALTPTGVVAEDGGEREADVVVLSTGFASNDFLAPMEIRGLDGLELNELWRHGAEAYLGVSVAGFPNLFIMYGPNTNLGSGSIIYQLESQMSYILDAVRTLERAGGGQLAVRPEVQREFNEEVQRRLEGAVWQTGCNNWYVNEEGRNVNNWPGFTREYRRRTKKLDLADYQLSTRAE